MKCNVVDGCGRKPAAAEFADCHHHDHSVAAALQQHLHVPRPGGVGRGEAQG